MKKGNKRRVVVTGMDTINPLGDTLGEYYENLLKGKSGITHWSSIDLGEVECKIGGDLGGYDFTATLDKIRPTIPDSFYKTIRKLFKSSTFSNKMTMICALRAFIDAKLLNNEIDPFNACVCVGGHNINSRYIHKNILQFADEPEYIDPLLGVEALDPNIAGCISEILNIQGPTLTVGGACASGNLALREGFRNIFYGESNMAVVAGAPYDMIPLDIHASVFLNAVVSDPLMQKDPARASRPFDVKRQGFVLSHGAGAMILEELESAVRRNASIYAELLGACANSNGCHLPAPSSQFQAKLIRQLLEITEIPLEAVDYVNCHATSTPLGDLEEIRAIKTVFDSHAYSMKLNAPKSMLGHTCWAAPIVETIGGILQMRYGKLHPSINIEEIEPEIDLDVCANSACEHPVEYMLKNSFGFGGINCCTLYRQFRE